MERDKLRASFEKLRSEIDALEASDEASRTRLKSLLADLERKLSHPDDSEHHRMLTRNVRSAIEHFEVEHPGTTAILNHIMVTLGNMGI